MPASSRASQVSSSTRRCCGSIATASRGEMPKNSASNEATSSRNPPGQGREACRSGGIVVIALSPRCSDRQKAAGSGAFGSRQARPVTATGAAGTGEVFGAVLAIARRPAAGQRMILGSHRGTPAGKSLSLEQPPASVAALKARQPGPPDGLKEPRRAEDVPLPTRRAARRPDARRPGCPNVQVTGSPDARMRGCPNVPVTGCPGARVTGWTASSPDGRMVRRPTGPFRAAARRLRRR